MKSEGEDVREFERHARALLGRSVARVGGRVRSRLTRARFAALEEAARRGGRRTGWRSARSFALLPAAGALAAAVLVALTLWAGRPDRSLPTHDGFHATFEDLDMLADGEALELVEDWDRGFYEWAAAQGELAEGTRG